MVANSENKSAFKSWPCCLHVVHHQLSVCPFVYKLFTNHFLQNHWSSFNQTLHKTFFGKGDSSLFKWRAIPFSKGRWYWNNKNTLTIFLNLFLQNHLDEGKLGLFTKKLWKAMPFSNKRKKILMKNIFLQNHLAYFNQTWHKASFGEVDSSLFKCN